MSDTIAVEDLAEPLTLSTDVYLSEEYARAEGVKLWAKVWQHAGRVEDIPNVGDFITYDIGNESILIVRAASDSIKAFYNVCSHRGRQLAEAPNAAHSCRGTKQKLFVCNYHGWQDVYKRQGWFFARSQTWWCESGSRLATSSRARRRCSP